jgi:hypothetical protein
MSDWHEILVAGTGDAVDSLVAEAGPQRPVRGEDLALHAGSFPERILEFLGAKTHHVLFAPADQARELRRRIEANPDLHLERVREVKGASFAFTAEAYSHRAAERIKTALHDDLPAGVALVGCEESEERDPDAKGVELYTPVHDYTYRATGRFTGTPPGIFELHRRMQDLDFVKEKELEIEGREIDSATPPSPGA